MPVWLRKHTFNKIRDYYEKKNNINQENTVEKSIKNMKAAGAVNNTKVRVPTYVTKASKK